MVNKKTTTSKKEGSLLLPVSTQKDLRDCFLGELKTTYWIEQQLLKRYDKLQSAANLPKVVTDQAHATVDANIKKLEKVFQELNIAPSGTKSLVVTELINELNGATKSAVKKDRAINISVALLFLKISLYELATFQGLLTLSKNLAEATVISYLEELLATKNKSIEIIQLAFEDIAGQLRRNNEKENAEDEIPVAAVYDSINLTGKVTKN